MEDASSAMSLARCRIAIGVAAVVAPRLATRVMGGRRRSEAVAPLFARMLGGRDIALGLGTVIALDRGKPVRGWLEGSVLADAVDCVACVLARGDMSPGAFSAAAGLGATSALLGGLIVTAP
jgi:peptide-methionine (R)-S-oxide reductase